MFLGLAQIQAGQSIMNLFSTELLILLFEITKMTKIINYNETELFKKDFKKLKKRFNTLDDDFDVAKNNVIELFHVHDIDNQSVFIIPEMNNEKIKIYKMRKFACKALKGRGVQSGIRIIYVYYLESATVTFLEIYFKGDKENEDKHRIKAFLNRCFESNL